MSLSQDASGHATSTLGTLAGLVAAGFLLLAPAPARAQQKPERGKIIVPSSSVVRPQDRGVRAHTNYLIFIPAKGNGKKPGGGGPPGSGNTGPAGETPGSLECVYGLTSSLSTGCPTSTAALQTGGSQTIAIVDAYAYSTAMTDFNYFSNQFGLPSGSKCGPNSNKACLTVVPASSGKLRSDSGWDLEQALDIEWAHAMAPQAQIILVEAKSSSLTNLLTAVQVATNEVQCGSTTTCSSPTGTGEVSMSWGSSEFSGEIADDYYFLNPGVTYFASSGDTGGVVIWPSASPNVVSAGGTSLHRNSSGAFTGETGWSGSGGGPSAYEGEPKYQLDANIDNKNGQRDTPDFSYDADPASGVSVYDTTSYEGLSGWITVGGTSVASPSLAGIVNFAGNFNSENGEQYLIYQTYSGSTSGCNAYSGTSYAFNDIISGTAGSYTAAGGWDFVTGVGSNNGTCGK